jgi:DNA polymerase I-like protein with 3'-5' exonuclease and polymerase domains
MTDNKTLDKLKATTDDQKEFLKLRKELGKVSAALSKSLEFFKGVCDERGGTFRAEFNQTSTATHRLSSSGTPLKFEQFDDYKTAQFQNLARVFKPLFSSRYTGWDMAEIDGAQLEFRVAAELGGPDAQALSDLESGHDVHVFTASQLLNLSVSEVSKKQRQAAKSETFKPLYGGSKGTKAQERYYAAFRKRYPGINAAQSGWLEEVLETKRLVTPWGMRYYWPYAKRSGRDGWVNCTSAVYNYPVQALATAEIIPIAVVYFWHRMLPWAGSISLVNTVHDSVIVENNPAYRDVVRELAIQCFTKDVYKYLEKVYGMDFTVPLGVACTFGTHWSEGEEESYNVWKTGKMEKVK